MRLSLKILDNDSAMQHLLERKIFPASEIAFFKQVQEPLPATDSRELPRRRLLKELDEMFVHFWQLDELNRIYGSDPLLKVWLGHVNSEQEACDKAINSIGKELSTLLGIEADYSLDLEEWPEE